MLPVKKREAWKYVQDDGSCPFDEWFETISDVKTEVRIDRRVRHLEEGNFGDHKNLGDKLLEARIDYGPGWRIYFTVDRGDIILLLIGGIKRTQGRDIEKARKLLREYATKQKKKKWYSLA